jgi:diadenosine tetraphosphate (Ap4A) HIT family hydrolase
MNATSEPGIDRDFVLDPQLARDTSFVGDLPLARVLLMNDANYPWLILVPRHAGAVEILDLDEDQRTQLMSEIALLAQVLKDVTAGRKINIGAIGNVVAQLHLHVVARHPGDAAWPRPVWGLLPARPYDQAARDRLIQAVRGEIAFG